MIVEEGKVMEHKNPLHFTIITVTPSVDVLLFCHLLLLVRADLYRRDCIAELYFF